MSRQGSTFLLETPVYIKSYAAAVGKKEGEGPLGHAYDFVGTDNRFGEETWEKSESRMISTAYGIALNKAQLEGNNLCCVFGGDLLNQCIATSFALRQLDAPFLGIYGACSTMAEGMLLGSLTLCAGLGQHLLCTAASHFCSAERQYRYPLEYGGQRPPTAQWTATAAGAIVLSLDKTKIRVKAITPGKIYDPGVTDSSNMGAAMAQSAYETLKTHFNDTNTKSTDYDLIVTGDLAEIGKGIVRKLFLQDGVTLGEEYNDCGCMMYSEQQDVAAGASGCGCSAAVLCAHILPAMDKGQLRRVLFCGTGALLSPVSTNQGESIPGICHLISLEVVQ